MISFYMELFALNKKNYLCDFVLLYATERQ